MRTKYVGCEKTLRWENIRLNEFYKSPVRHFLARYMFLCFDLKKYDYNSKIPFPLLQFQNKITRNKLECVRRT